MSGIIQQLELRKGNTNLGTKMKQKGICIDCGLTALVNKNTHRCRMCQSKKEGSYWLPSEERSFKQRMMWRYKQKL